ncbi:unnamed protein product [Linum trigynum]|uniref:Uncharacterized protein n=1 Tax=Linum trigynum TaxID=586398 RepID=A0AAV2E1W6_9ROSI
MLLQCVDVAIPHSATTIRQDFDLTSHQHTEVVNVVGRASIFGTIVAGLILNYSGRVEGCGVSLPNSDGGPSRTSVRADNQYSRDGGVDWLFGGGHGAQLPRGLGGGERVAI